MLQGIGGLGIKRTAGLNLVVGCNGIGKISLIEAIWLFCNRRNSHALWHLDLSRSGYEYVNPIAELGCRGEINMKGTQNGMSHTYQAMFETFAVSPENRRKKG